MSYIFTYKRGSTFSWTFLASLLLLFLVSGVTAIEISGTPTTNGDAINLEPPPAAGFNNNTGSVNSTDFWDALDTPADILTSLLNDDAGFGTYNHDQDLNTTDIVRFRGLNITNATGTLGLYVDENGRVGINTYDLMDSFTVVDGMDLIHTSTFSDDHAFEIDLDANGFGDVKAIDINYITGAIATGNDEEAILVNFNQFLATGGDIVGLEVLATEGGAVVTGLQAGALVNPVEQLSGVFEDMDSASNDGVDNLAEFISTASDVAFFVADNDFVTIGNSVKFEEIEFILDTPASVDTKPTFEFSIGSGTWTTFTPTDGTNGMRNTGVIAWRDSDIPTWAKGAGAEFLIRITRTKNTLTTNPIEDKVQISVDTEFFWDKEGYLKVNNITVVNNVYAKQFQTADMNITKDAIEFGDTWNSRITSDSTGKITINAKDTDDDVDFDIKPSNFFGSDLVAIEGEGTFLRFDNSILMTGTDYIGFGDLLNVQLRYDSPIGVHMGLTPNQHYIFGDQSDYQDVDRQPNPIIGASPVIVYSTDATDSQDFIRIYADTEDDSYIDFGSDNTLYIGDHTQKNVSINQRGDINVKGIVSQDDGYFFGVDDVGEITVPTTAITIPFGNPIINDLTYTIDPSTNENITFNRNGLYKFNIDVGVEILDIAGGARTNILIYAEENSTGTMVEIPYSISGGYIREVGSNFTTSTTFMKEFNKGDDLRVRTIDQYQGTPNFRTLHNGSRINIELLREI